MKGRVYQRGSSWCSSPELSEKGRPFERTVAASTRLRDADPSRRLAQNRELDQGC